MRQKKTSGLGKSNSVGELGAEIFRRVQESQGRGFISDGIEGLADYEQFFSVVRGHLKHSEKTVRVIRKFLREHGEL